MFIDSSLDSCLYKTLLRFRIFKHFYANTASHPSDSLHRVHPGDDTNQFLSVGSSTAPKPTTALGFLQLPVELRFEIYRMLLHYDGIIDHQLCIRTKAAVLLLRGPATETRQLRQKMFPTILQTCHLIHLEGNRVLYGENRFRIEHATWNHNPIIKSWHLPTYFGTVRKLNLCFYGSYHSLYPASFTEQLGSCDSLHEFPGLRDLNIHLKDITTQEWNVFLEIFAQSFFGVGTITITIDTKHIGKLLIRQQPNQPRQNNAYKYLPNKEVATNSKDLQLRTYLQDFQDFLASWDKGTSKLNISIPREGFVDIEEDSLQIFLVSV
jgi:hypothetical protein